MKIIKNYEAYAKCDGGKALGDDSTCAIRAFTIASGYDYEEVYHIAKKHGRIDGHGTYDSVLFKMAHELGFRTIIIPKIYTPQNFLYPTLKHVLDKYVRSTDECVITTPNHAFAYCFGELHDWKSSKVGLRSRIDLLFIKESLHT